MKPKAATTNIPVPALSTSLESVLSNDFDDAEVASAPATASILSARPGLRRNDSACSTSRGREKHITPIDLEKIVISIKEAKQLEPIELPRPAPQHARSPAPLATHASKGSLQIMAESLQPDCQNKKSQHKIEGSQATIESSTSTVESNASGSTETQTVGSEHSSSTEMSTHSIVRGFVAGGAPSSYRSQTHLAAHMPPTPILKNSPSYRQTEIPRKKKGPMFTIGTSSGEDESSLETRYRSSMSDNIRRPDGSDGSTGSKKQTTFKEEVAIGRAAEHSPVFESDDEDDEVSESAIDDDDDSSDWEDSDEQSNPSSVNEKEMVFHRVDSRPNLTSRRSMLTTLMNEPDRARALQNAASRSTPALRRSRTSTPSGPSVATSPEPSAQLMLPPQGHPPPQSGRSKPIIMTTSNTHPQQLALSPRTTRRNMLSTELTESLRKNLLWERQHRSTGNLAALQRRHTAQDMSKLQQRPESVAMSQGEHTKNFTNEYFHAGLQEYHAKGW
ncbi:hypothetical protein LTR62_008317 [Meristemomyces frigidus]|uniref:DUF3295 domain-containing protein n=1 Tax=Meristemomyces frigidus TaxID=1508187 RepID=A0AAN7YCQ0_9PEZI|nr:hypothetical protein LTR62_008317 [Meristemomyces frigidus]